MVLKVRGLGALSAADQMSAFSRQLGATLRAQAGWAAVQDAFWVREKFVIPTSKSASLPRFIVCKLELRTAAAQRFADALLAPQGDGVTLLPLSEGSWQEASVTWEGRPRKQRVRLVGVPAGTSLAALRTQLEERSQALRQPVKVLSLDYAIDPDMVAASLDRIASLDFSWLIPGHGEPAARDDALRDIAFHKAQIAGIEARVVELLVKPHSTEEAIAAVSADRGLSDNPAQYWLAVTTVKGYLGDLLARGVIEFYVKEHAGHWHSL